MPPVCELGGSESNLKRTKSASQSSLDCLATEDPDIPNVLVYDLSREFPELNLNALASAFTRLHKLAISGMISRAVLAVLRAQRHSFM